MPLPFNAGLMADIAHVSARAERFAIRCQFEANSPAELQWAETLKRHARAMQKLMLEPPGSSPAAGSASPTT